MAKFTIGKGSSSKTAPTQESQPTIVEKEVIKEIIKEVPVVQYVDRIVKEPVEVIKEVEKIVQVPVEVIKQEVVEIIKEVPVEIVKEVVRVETKTEIEYVDRIKVHYKIPRWAIALMILEGLLLVITNI